MRIFSNYIVQMTDSTEEIPIDTGRTKSNQEIQKIFQRTIRGDTKERIRTNAKAK